MTDWTSADPLEAAALAWGGVSWLGLLLHALWTKLRADSWPESEGGIRR